MALTPTPPVRLAEIIGVLSLATDLGTGMPFEHGLRSCLLALRLADALGLNSEQASSVYYVTLLRFIGCTADSALWARIFGDEIALGAHFGGIDRANPRAFLRLLVRHLGAGDPPYRRARLLGTALSLAARYGQTSPAEHCEVGERLAARLSLAPVVADALGKVFERWDGKGLPRGLRGEEVPLSVRICLLVRDVDALYRLQGADVALAIVRERAGTAYDPAIAACFRRQAAELLSVLDTPTVWQTVLEAEPGSRPCLAGDQVDTALRAIADFTDLKSPYTGNHSSGVARLAHGAARRCRLPPADVRALQHAALLHDLGRVGISNSVWDKTTALSAGEWEQIRLHPYYTERLLARAPTLARLGVLAACHHERLDGAGYHRCLAAQALSPAARLLAAADVYHALTEPRPQRPARSPEEAAEELRREVRAGRIDAEAAEAVLAEAGHRTGVRHIRVADLTEREIEVLRLLVRGCPTKEIARTLVISAKTADHHIQHIYGKIGVSTRAGAVLFALQHDLVESV